MVWWWWVHGIDEGVNVRWNGMGWMDGEMLVIAMRVLAGLSYLLSTTMSHAIKL